MSNLLRCPSCPPLFTKLRTLPTYLKNPKMCSQISHNAPFCNRNAHTFLIQILTVWVMGLENCGICLRYRFPIPRYYKKPCDRRLLCTYDGLTVFTVTERSPDTVWKQDHRQIVQKIILPSLEAL